MLKFHTTFFNGGGAISNLGVQRGDLQGSQISHVIQEENFYFDNKKDAYNFAQDESILIKYNDGSTMSREVSQLYV